MQDHEVLQLAYGLGCIYKLGAAEIDPADFVKLAAQDEDPAIREMAHSVNAVIHHSYTDVAPLMNKVACAILDIDAENTKTAAGPGTLRGMWEVGKDTVGKMYRGGQQAAKEMGAMKGTAMQMDPRQLTKNIAGMETPGMIGEAAGMAGRHSGKLKAGLGAAGLAGAAGGGVGTGFALDEEPPQNTLGRWGQGLGGMLGLSAG